MTREEELAAREAIDRANETTKPAGLKITLNDTQRCLAARLTAPMMKYARNLARKWRMLDAEEMESVSLAALCEAVLRADMSNLKADKFCSKRVYWALRDEAQRQAVEELARLEGIAQVEGADEVSVRRMKFLIDFISKKAGEGHGATRFGAYKKVS